MTPSVAAAAGLSRNDGRSGRTRPHIKMQFVADGERTAGIELVERLLTTGEHDAVGLTPEVAAEAIEALEHLDIGWLVAEMIESGERFAEQVHSRATRGLQEVVQNAEDQSARNIRFGFRRRSRGAELVIAHDGNPVELGDVVRMAWPLLSGSRADADKIGRFGIGLKTLNQFGDRLAVHCPPLPGFEIRGGRITGIKTASAIRGFWDPSARETLFVLGLQDDRFDLAFFKDWLDEWDASSLLFLRHLQRVTLVDLNKSKTIADRGISVGPARPVAFDFPGATEAEQVTIRDTGSSRTWTRYAVRYRRPKSLKATHKEMGDTVRLQLAIPHRRDASRLYVGLPLEEPCTLPFSMCAPFEPNVDRTHLRDHNKLNEWLIARLGDLAVAVSVQRFAQPKTAWRTIPLEDEGAGASTWASTLFDDMARRHRDRVGKKVRLVLPDRSTVRLGDLVYEGEAFEPVLSTSDVERLWDETSSRFGGPRRAVPKSWRDTGRWRRVLEILDGAALSNHKALTILDWDDDEIGPRGAKWLVDLIYAAKITGELTQLWGRRCVGLTDGGARLAPSEIVEGGTLLVHTLPTEGLAATLGLAHQIARPFRARTEAAETVRTWLRERDVLREKASDADALRALARAQRSAPVDLRRRDAVLLRLRNSFEHLSPEQRVELGPGIGRNIAVRGYVFEKGAKKPTAVRPADAYLPSAIDKNEGWPAAAGQTPAISWIDTRYRDTLRGPRGQGALVFFKALGAATTPRLQRAAPPSDNPHATRLARRPLCDQHKHELASHPTATGLDSDWVSPDLEAVIADLRRERKPTVRRKRARALFLALDRSWEEQYAASSTATAVRHYHRWVTLGEVSATWVARLASEPWLSTRDSRLKPAAPRDLTILTEAAFEVEGENPEKYAAEIDAEHVDSPVVEALAIQGRPYASSILERLEALRTEDRSGGSIAQVWVDRSYQALASYAPGGLYAERSDLTARQLQHRFADRAGKGGLIRVNGEWLPPTMVRRDPFLDETLPRVTGADPLWDFLGVGSPTLSDCMTVTRELAARREANPSSEIRVARHLLSLISGQRRGKEQLRTMPLRTYSGWQTTRKETIFAVANPVLAEALGQKWPVWRAPLPLEELATLVPLLGVHELRESDFEADIPSHVAAADNDLQSEFVAAVGHLKDYLAVHHPSLHDRLAAARWQELAKAHVIVGSGWAIRVRGPRARSTRLTARAHLFENPVRFCVQHEDEAAEHDAGGQAMAGFFVGDQPAAEDRSTLALAWAYAFHKRREERDEIDLAPTDIAEDAPAPGTFGAFAGKGRKKIGRRVPPKRGAPAERELPRELTDLTQLDLTKVKGTFLEAKRRGTLRASRKAALTEPKTPPRPKSEQKAARAGQRHYSDADREDVAYRIVEAFLGDTHNLNLEDTRDQKSVGADAVDREKDIWIELKAHGREASDTLRLEPSEAERADAKRGHYWLVVVWNLEKPRTPEFVVIPDPLRRLDTYLGSGLKLSGVADLAAQQTGQKA